MKWNSLSGGHAVPPLEELISLGSPGSPNFEMGPQRCHLLDKCGKGISWVGRAHIETPKEFRVLMALEEFRLQQYCEFLRCLVTRDFAYRQHIIGPIVLTLVVWVNFRPSINSTQP